MTDDDMEMACAIAACCRVMPESVEAHDFDWQKIEDDVVRVTWKDAAPEFCESEPVKGPNGEKWWQSDIEI